MCNDQSIILFNHGAQKIKLTHQNLYSLQAAIYLAKKVAEKLGGSKVLQ